jgi:hypothetical protein
MGRSEYSTTITMAGVLPMPINGIKNPSRAKLGTAWITFVIPIIGFESFGSFDMKIPRGIPITIAIKTETILK